MKRAQIVLAMSVVVTVALVPVAAAYLQLGDVGHRNGADADATDHVARALDRSAAVAASAHAGDYTWPQRRAAVDAVRDTLAPRLARLRTAHVADTVGVAVAYNQTAAARVAATACPGGPGRQFGACMAHRGVVVQERAGETAVVAVAFDVRVVTPSGGTAFTRVVRWP